jgi:tRNA-dihydrouridine synthase
MSETSSRFSPRRLSGAPMLDGTARHTLLYTEMVTTGALSHGSAQRGAFGACLKNEPRTVADGGIKTNERGA